MLMTTAEEEHRTDHNHNHHHNHHHHHVSRNLSNHNADPSSTKSLDLNNHSTGNNRQLPTRSVRFGGKSFSGENLTIHKQYDSSIIKPVIGGYNDSLSTPSPSVTDKPCLPQDDGYSTDSKSNSSPSSTTSPLSSSSSSLSTFDGSFSTHATPTSSAAMTGHALRSSVQKHSLISGSGKIHVNRHAIMAAKKKDVVVQDLRQQDSPANLEDRLRALTTIQEEDSAMPNAIGQDGTARNHVSASPFLPHHPSSRMSPNVDMGSRGPAFNVSGQDLTVAATSGCFRAVPIEIVAPHDTRSNDDAIAHPALRNANDKNWHDYKRFFEKDSDIPLHNIDFSNKNKFVEIESDSVSNKGINRQLASPAPPSPPGSGISCAHVTAPHTQRIPSSQSGNTATMANFPAQQASFRGHPNHPHNPHHSAQQDYWDQANSQGQNAVPLPHPSDLGYHSLPRNLQTSALARRDHPYQLDPQQTFQKENWSTEPALSYLSHQQQHQQEQQQHQQEQQQQQQQEEQQQQRQQHHMQRFHQQHSMQTAPYHDVYVAHQHPSHSFEPGRSNSLKHSSRLDYLSSSLNPLPPNQSLNMPTSTRHQRDSSQFPQEDVVLRRSWAASSGHIGPQLDSRHPHLAPPGERLSVPGTERYSLDLGNIPQLQRQIRATSEMCLQASKRHVFASSADIYKLFQGQNKNKGGSGAPGSSSASRNFPRSRDQFNRHSFHAMPGGSSLKPHNLHTQPPPSKENLSTSRGQTALLSTFPPAAHQASSSPGPLRADHLLLPQMAWTSSLHPSSSSNSNTPTPLPVSLSDINHFQRQSSGYSSENELQQIEQNAMSAKQNGQEGTVGPDQQFVPVDPSLDQDSSSSLADTEPIYVNQPALASLRMQHSAGQTLGQAPPHPPSPPPPPLPARPDRLQKSLVPDSNLVRHDQLPNSRMGPSPSSTPPMTQHQVINLRQRPVTIRSYVPKMSYSQANSNGSPDQIFDPGENVVGGHILTLNPPDMSPSQDNNFALEYSRSHNQKNKNINPAAGVVKGNNSFNSQRSKSGSRVQLSPLEIAQVLEVPFATSVISDEAGDRLSTLV